MRLSFIKNKNGWLSNTKPSTSTLVYDLNLISILSASNPHLDKKALR